jgi:hypothetical protein
VSTSAFFLCNGKTPARTVCLGRQRHSRGAEKGGIFGIALFRSSIESLEENRPDMRRNEALDAFVDKVAVYALVAIQILNPD